MTDYLTRWAEAMPIKDCIVAMTTKFLFENVVTRFRGPNILIIDQGTHFVNQLIEQPTEEFQIQHKRTTLNHPQSNGVVEEINKIMENVLRKVCNARRDDWHQNISAILWHIARCLRI